MFYLCFNTKATFFFTGDEESKHNANSEVDNVRVEKDHASKCTIRKEHGYKGKNGAQENGSANWMKECFNYTTQEEQASNNVDSSFKWNTTAAFVY